ncbi:MAG: MFS transporter [Acidimicrobiia bacterium]
MSPHILGSVLASSQLVTHGLGLYLVAALLPLISADLGLGYDRLGFVVGASTVGYVLGSLAGSRIPSRTSPVAVLIGLHLAMAGCFGAFTLARHPLPMAVVAGAIGLLASPGWLSVVRIGGVGTGSGLVLSMASSGGAVGLIVNATVLGLLSEPSQWRIGFWVAAAISVLVALAVSLLPILAGGAAAEAVEVRSPWVVLVIAACAAAATSTFVAFVVAMVVDELGASPVAGAAVVVVGGVSGIVSAPVMGTMIDRAGPVRALQLGAAMFAGPLLLAAAWPSLGALLVAAVGFGFLNYPVWAVIGTALGRSLPPAAVNRVMSWALVSFGLSASVAVPATGLVFDATGTLRPGLVVFALVCVVMAMLAPRLEAPGRRDGLAVGSP